MTVKELIELNQMITDVVITVRKDGSALLDQLNIGLAEGIKPPYPTKVPKSEKYIGNMSAHCQKEALYINKSINAWDDGRDYWQIKPDRIPKKWLELEVYSWEVWQASRAISGRRSNYNANFPNVNFHGEQINITALPSGQNLAPKPKLERTDEQIDGSDGYHRLFRRNSMINEWIPIDQDVPKNDSYVLVSFSNFSFSDIGRYEENEDGGAFYPDDDEKSYSSYGMFVNAWMPLPECMED